VRFGIEAPRSVVIDRAEIHERKKRAALANGNAARSGGNRRGHEPGTCANGNVNGNVLEEQEPSAASLMAMARPKPRPAPVARAT
jgi:hypothetical protein